MYRIALVFVLLLSLVLSQPAPTMRPTLSLPEENAERIASLTEEIEKLERELNECDCEESEESDESEHYRYSKGRRYSRRYGKSYRYSRWGW
mmetsp:Transcript_63225/g.77395  ORF Transcript_63225/g.77395 Transcript_63225/m.77395 type:complete len:92 (+) Transcript_63225:129-404(+)